MLDPRISKHFALGMMVALPPIAAVVQQHMSWEKSSQSKKRMLTHHSVFWGLYGLSAFLLHRVLFNRKLEIGAKALRLLPIAAIGTCGFKAGELIAGKLFPHQSDSPPAPKTVPPLSIFQEMRPSPLAGEGGRRPIEGFNRFNFPTVPTANWVA